MERKPSTGALVVTKLYLKTWPRSFQWEENSDRILKLAHVAQSETPEQGRSDFCFPQLVAFPGPALMLWPCPCSHHPFGPPLSAKTAHMVLMMPWVQMCIVDFCKRPHTAQTAAAAV